MSTGQDLERAVPTLTGAIVPAPVGTLSPLAQAAVDAGVPGNTERAYAADWRRFTEWCGQTGRAALPASEDTLTEYATYLAYVAVPGGSYQPWLATGGRRGLSPNSITRAFAAINSRHAEAGHQMASRERVKKVLRGYRAQLAQANDPRATPKQATAITVASLRVVIDKLDISEPQNLRNVAMLLLGFAVAARVGELVRIQIGDVKVTELGLDVKVYRVKVRKHQQVAIPSKDVPLIVAIIKQWIGVLAELGRTAGALFPRFAPHGKRLAGGPAVAVTEGQVRRVFRAIGKKLFGEHWTGHGVRRGLATQARWNGHDAVKIAQQGGWDRGSVALLGYLDDADRWVDNALEGTGL